MITENDKTTGAGTETSIPAQTNKEAGPETSIPAQTVDTSKVGGETKQLTEQERYAAEFSDFKNMSINELQSSAPFARKAAKALTEAITKLPTAKYLVQSFEKSPSLRFYERFIEKVFNGIEFIPVGQGGEYCLVDGESVNVLDASKFTPGARNDIDNTTYWSTITIPSDIYENQVSVATWKYQPYFLTGKVDEVANIVVNEGTKALARKQYTECFNLLKTMQTEIQKVDQTPIANLYNDDATKYLTGDENADPIDALTDVANIISDMEQDNLKYCYDSDNFTGYNNAIKDDLVIIAHPQTIHNLQKYSATFAAKDNLKEISNFSNWAMIPQRIKNPDTTTPNSPTGQNAELKRVEIGYNGSDRIKGFVMIVAKSALKRLANLNSRDAEYFANNMTTQYFNRARFTQGVLPWAQCAIYVNPALEAPFVLPVKQVNSQVLTTDKE